MFALWVVVYYISWVAYKLAAYLISVLVNILSGDSMYNLYDICKVIHGEP